MRISIIAAVSENNVIGKKGQLPWKLSDDLKNFKKLTTGHIIIMGRKTFESIGKPLPNRVNIVLSRSTDYSPKDVIVVNNFKQALDTAKKMQDDEIFVIGGQSVYNKALRYADRLYLTKVKTEIDGDTFFPEWDEKKWKQISKKTFKGGDKNDFDFDIITYDKKEEK